MDADSRITGRRQIAKGRVTAVMVVIVFPVADDTRAGASDQKLLMLRHSSRMRELNDAT